MKMRVVAGVYGGRPLKSLTGRITRPTMDKVRGAIFNMVGPYFDGGHVLDLYAGSGALAIEAVSRGVDAAVLVEQDHSAQEIIVENIATTQEQEKFTLLKMSAKTAVSSYLKESFDLVFLDPPYANREISRDIEKLWKQNLLSEMVTVVCETDKRTELPDTVGTLTKMKEKTYGITRVTIYQ